MPRYQIIVNPTSGRGAGLKSVDSIKQYFENQGWTYDICLTERPWHAAEITRASVAAGYDVILGVGGDGTANEVINGLMMAQQAGLGKAAMGMLAVGRGNDFAYSMHIPAGLEAGFQTINLNHRDKIDVGRVTGGDYPQGRYFGNGIGIGFDAVVGFEALKLTWLTGFPSYLVAVLKTLFLYFRAPLVEIAYDKDCITLSALMVSIMNGRRMGGGFMMAPDSCNGDGLLDVCIAKQVSRGRILTLIPHFLKGDQATQEEIITFRASRVDVTAVESVLPAHADGETLCTQGERLTIELLPAQIDLICLPQQEAT